MFSKILVVQCVLKKILCFYKIKKTVRTEMGKSKHVKAHQVPSSVKLKKSKVKIVDSKLKSVPGTSKAMCKGKPSYIMKKKTLPVCVTNRKNIKCIESIKPDACAAFENLSKTCLNVDYNENVISNSNICCEPDKLGETVIVSGLDSLKHQKSESNIDSSLLNSTITEPANESELLNNCIAGDISKISLVSKSNENSDNLSHISNHINTHSEFSLVKNTELTVLLNYLLSKASSKELLVKKLNIKPIMKPPDSECDENSFSIAVDLSLLKSADMYMENKYKDSNLNSLETLEAKVMDENDERNILKNMKRNVLKPVPLDIRNEGKSSNASISCHMQEKRKKVKSFKCKINGNKRVCDEIFPLQSGTDVVSSSLKDSKTVPSVSDMSNKNPAVAIYSDNSVLTVNIERLEDNKALMSVLSKTSEKEIGTNKLSLNANFFTDNINLNNVHTRHMANDKVPSTSCPIGNNYSNSMPLSAALNVSESPEKCDKSLSKSKQKLRLSWESDETHMVNLKNGLLPTSDNTKNNEIESCNTQELLEKCASFRKKRSKKEELQVFRETDKVPTENFKNNFIQNSDNIENTEHLSSIFQSSSCLNKITISCDNSNKNTNLSKNNSFHPERTSNSLSSNNLLKESENISDRHELVCISETNDVSFSDESSLVVQERNIQKGINGHLAGLVCEDAKVNKVCSPKKSKTEQRNKNITAVNLETKTLNESNCSNNSIQEFFNSSNGISENSYEQTNSIQSKVLSSGKNNLTIPEENNSKEEFGIRKKFQTHLNVSSDTKTCINVNDNTNSSPSKLKKIIKEKSPACVTINPAIVKISSPLKEKSLSKDMLGQTALNSFNQRPLHNFNFKELVVNVERINESNFKFTGNFSENDKCDSANNKECSPSLSELPVPSIVTRMPSSTSNPMSAKDLSVDGYSKAKEESPENNKCSSDFVEDAKEHEKPVTSNSLSCVNTVDKESRNVKKRKSEHVDKAHSSKMESSNDTNKKRKLQSKPLIVRFKPMSKSKISIRKNTLSKDVTAIESKSKEPNEEVLDPDDDQLSIPKEHNFKYSISSDEKRTNECSTKLDNFKSKCSTKSKCNLKITLNAKSNTKSVEYSSELKEHIPSDLESSSLATHFENADNNKKEFITANENESDVCHKLKNTKSPKKKSISPRKTNIENQKFGCTSELNEHVYKVSLCNNLVTNFENSDKNEAEFLKAHESDSDVCSKLKNSKSLKRKTVSPKKTCIENQGTESNRENSITQLNDLCKKSCMHSENSVNSKCMIDVCSNSPSKSLLLNCSEILNTTKSPKKKSDSPKKVNIRKQKSNVNLMDAITSTCVGSNGSGSHIELISGVSISDTNLSSSQILKNSKSSKKTLNPHKNKRIKIQGSQTNNEINVTQLYQPSKINSSNSKNSHTDIKQIKHIPKLSENVKHSKTIDNKQFLNSSSDISKESLHSQTQPKGADELSDFIVLNDDLDFEPELAEECPLESNTTSKSTLSTISLANIYNSTTINEALSHNSYIISNNVKSDIIDKNFESGHSPIFKKSMTSDRCSISSAGSPVSNVCNPSDSGFPGKRLLSSDDDSGSDNESDNFKRARRSSSRNEEVHPLSNENSPDDLILPSDTSSAKFSSYSEKSDTVDYTNIFPSYSSGIPFSKPNVPDIFPEYNPSEIVEKTDMNKYFNTLHDLVDELRFQCSNGMIQIAIETAEQYIIISHSIEANSIIVQELFKSWLEYSLKSNNKNFSNQEIEMILRLVNNHDIYDKDLISLLISECCSHSDLNIYAVRLFHLCQSKSISLDKQAVVKFEGFLKSESITLPVLLDFLHHVKSFCEVHISSEIVQLALEKCQENNCLNIQRVYSLIQSLEPREISKSSLILFLRLCFKKGMWSDIIEMFIYWEAKFYFTNCLYEALAAEMENVDDYFRDIVFSLHNMVRSLPEFHEDVIVKIGTSLLLYAVAEERHERAMGILYTLHQYNIDYFGSLLNSCSDCRKKNNSISDFVLTCPYLVPFTKKKNNGISDFVLTCPYIVAFTAIDLCLLLKNPNDAFIVFKGFSWIKLAEYLDIESRQYILKEKFQYLLKCLRMGISNCFDESFEAFEVLVSLINKDLPPEVLQQSAQDLKVIYNQFIVNLLNCNKIDMAKHLYDYGVGEKKDIFSLSAAVIRGLLVSFSDHDMIEMLNPIFSLGIMRHVYNIEKPQQESYPWCMTIQSHWFECEIKLAVEEFLKRLFPLLRNKPERTDYEKWFTVKLLFKVHHSNDTELLNCLKCSHLDANSSLQRTAKALQNMAPSLIAVGTSNSKELYITADSVYNFWKCHAVPSPNIILLPKDAGKRNMTFGKETKSFVKSPDTALSESPHLGQVMQLECSSYSKTVVSPKCLSPSLYSPVSSASVSDSEPSSEESFKLPPLTITTYEPPPKNTKKIKPEDSSFSHITCKINNDLPESCMSPKTKFVNNVISCLKAAEDESNVEKASNRSDCFAELKDNSKSVPGTPARNQSVMSSLIKKSKKILARKSKRGRKKKNKSSNKFDETVPTEHVQNKSKSLGISKNHNFQNLTISVLTNTSGRSVFGLPEVMSPPVCHSTEKKTGSSKCSNSPNAFNNDSFKVPFSVRNKINNKPKALQNSQFTVKRGVNSKAFYPSFEASNVASCSQNVEFAHSSSSFQNYGLSTSTPSVATVQKTLDNSARMCKPKINRSNITFPSHHFPEEEGQKSFYDWRELEKNIHKPHEQSNKNFNTNKLRTLEKAPSNSQNHQQGNLNSSLTCSSEILQKVIFFLKRIYIKKYKDTIDCDNKVLMLAETFVKENNIVRKLDPRSMKILTDFANTRV